MAQEQANELGARIAGRPEDPDLRLASHGGLRFARRSYRTFSGMQTVPGGPQPCEVRGAADPASPLPPLSGKMEPFET